MSAPGANSANAISSSSTASSIISSPLFICEPSAICCELLRLSAFSFSFAFNLIVVLQSPERLVWADYYLVALFYLRVSIIFDFDVLIAFDSGLDLAEVRAVIAANYEHAFDFLLRFRA